MGDESGTGRWVLSSHGPLGSHQQQVPLQRLLAGPGCALVFLLVSPAMTRRIWQGGCLFLSPCLPALTPEIRDSFGNLQCSWRPQFLET